MTLLLTNLATSTLAAGIAAGATSITVPAGEGARFPVPNEEGQWFPLLLVGGTGLFEIVRCTARFGDTLTIARAQEGTTAKAFVAGDRVDLRITAAGFGTFADKDAVAAALAGKADGAATDAALATKADADATAAALGTKLDKTGGVVTGTIDFNKALSASNKLLGLMQGYSLFSDNIGDGPANSRLWLDALNGGQIVVGPRSGSASLHEVLIRTESLFRQGLGTGELRVLDTGDLATLFTQMGALGNNAANGYFRLPPPLPAMLQYGIVTPGSGVSDFTLSWPVSFPNACRAAIGMPVFNNSGSNEFAVANLSNLGAASCTCRSRYLAGSGPVGPTSAMPIAFLALGY